MTLAHAGRTARVEPAVFGEHQGYNMAAAVAAAVALGLDFEQAANRLHGVHLDSRWRMEVQELRWRHGDQRRVQREPGIHGRWTAGAGQHGPGPPHVGRTWGDARTRPIPRRATTMRRPAGVRLNISQLVVVGEGARPIHMGAAHEGSWDGESIVVPDVDEAVAVLRAGLPAR